MRRFTPAAVKVAPWWGPVAALAGTVVPFVTMAQASVVQSTGALLHLAGHGWIALRVLRRSDIEWHDGAKDLHAVSP
ncbi:hypothetical protein [Nonomuraea sp. NPDC001699]